MTSAALTRLPQIGVSPLTLLLALFVLSGFSALIYQSIWTHYLGLMLGHAAHAQTLVLVMFMGGMAAGAWWISRTTLRPALRALQAASGRARIPEKKAITNSRSSSGGSSGGIGVTPVALLEELQTNAPTCSGRFCLVRKRQAYQRVAAIWQLSVRSAPSPALRRAVSCARRALYSRCLRHRHAECVATARRSAVASECRAAR